ncbi:uncharacterized protein KNAG_0C06610 [Huiozyma naganishii CBS 8797]|uniref:DAGKc domain-containing protein n=1 Tax=Huiozyma naganishii (strain ATCC MYA-139 / BCRC 22969 / CBS 8797 / KCTC 17520 / NBRC 10181 / NCYC 3082 / Yp74L-3) TaxID=1071383 RepID=J7RJR8_HUIN7|nr:hypothetical protein KNAG_0C06610 [Kazachstania naganishii CBS 8797]CCK69753.1 hypothetical protein KNAG_0C06610 [Kazachstania naganishii CBS 8797]
MITTVRKHLVDFCGERISVEIDKDGSKYTKFALLSEPCPQECAPPQLFTRENLIVLDSVHSGTGRTSGNDITVNVIEPVLRRLHARYQVVKSQNSKSVAEFGNQLDPTQSYTILFVSGDTSVSEFFNGVGAGVPSPRSSLTILPIAMGTGNALANSLNLNCPVEAFASFLRGELVTAEFPLYRAILPDGETSVVFFIVLSLGFHANLLHAAENEKYKSMGVERFQEASGDILQNYKLQEQITLDKQGVAGSYAYFALVNVPNLEASYIPSPQSDPFKHELHLLAYSSSLNRKQLLERIMAGYKNRRGDELTADPYTTYKRISEGFEIKLQNKQEGPNDPAFELCLDGQLYNLLQYKSDQHQEELTIQVELIDSALGSFDILVMGKH